MSVQTKQKQCSNLNSPTTNWNSASFGYKRCSVMKYQKQEKTARQFLLSFIRSVFIIFISKIRGFA
jgi:hypothetical protein